MKKGKTAAVIIAAVLIVCTVFVLLYFFVISSSEKDDTVQENMITWSASQTPGLYLMVPDDYTVTESSAGNVDDFRLYHKDDARIKFTSDYTDNDLVNYSADAIDQYKKITDGFRIIKEYDDILSESTTVHVTEFDYSLNSSEGVLNYSCLSAITIGNGRSYLVTCTCDGGNYEKYRDDFVRTYKTMRIITETEYNTEK